MFALPLVGRRAFLAQLLLLLVELLHELLDFLIEVFVSSWTSAPNHRYNNCCDGGSSSQRLVIVIGLLLVVVLILAVTTLDCNARIRLATLPRLWGWWRVPGTDFSSPSAFVRQAEELSDILDVMRGELPQHLLIPYSLTECNHNRSIANTWDGVANLGKPLGEGLQRFPWVLLHDMEVSLFTRP
jgi:hypothetical protein